MNILYGDIIEGKMPIVTVLELEHCKQELETISVLMAAIRLSMQGAKNDPKHVEEQLAALAWLEKRRKRIGRRVRHFWLWEDAQTLMEAVG